MASFAVLAANVEYIFDLEDIKSGTICIEKYKKTGQYSIDVQRLSSHHATNAEALENPRKVDFTVHDCGNNCLLVSIIWD
jgi:hypothetical protein